MFASALRTTLVLAVTLLAGLPTLPAQTTPTERAAAGAVLKAIDSLQGALAPMSMGGRLVAAKDADRQKIV